MPPKKNIDSELAESRKELVRMKRDQLLDALRRNHPYGAGEHASNEQGPSAHVLAQGTAGDGI